MGDKMKDSNKLKEIVKTKYSQIAVNSMSPKKSCGCGCNESPEYSMIGEEYSNIEGYVKEADLNLGCGLPTKYADIKTGDTVLDLGSGAGNDAFVAREITGSTGLIIGLDFTDEMILKAEQNRLKMGYDNVEFKLGDIENMPIENDKVDVVISNCVMNLVPDKRGAFSEVYRVLKNRGHFCISDIVIEGEMPEELKKSAEAYAGCVSGALPIDQYLNIISEAGFKNVEIKKQNIIQIPEEIMNEYLAPEEIKIYNEKKPGIFSITVIGYKN